MKEKTEGGEPSSTTHLQAEGSAPPEAGPGWVLRMGLTCRKERLA